MVELVSTLKLLTVLRATQLGVNNYPAEKISYIKVAGSEGLAEKCLPSAYSPVVDEIRGRGNKFHSHFAQQTYYAPVQFVLRVLIRRGDFAAPYKSACAMYTAATSVITFNCCVKFAPEIITREEKLFSPSRAMCVSLAEILSAHQTNA